MSGALRPERLPFVKGHGTENDFVVLPDLDDRIALDAELVRAICDRRAGIGGDGVLRVLRRGGRWFMDYRNADGSVVETCGNGIRVFARYLVSSGLAPAGVVTVETRAGEREVVVPADGGDISVSMGPATPLPDARVVVHRHDAEPMTLAAVGISMGNPHLIALALPPDSLATFDLTCSPGVDPAGAYPEGVNVELVERVGPSGLRMRVHERGAGETRSCGTGACAAAVAAMTAAAERTSYDVDVPGGRLRIDWRADGEVVLHGPAQLVASGEIDVPALRAACHHAGLERPLDESRRAQR
jgi:diaminopimelate epimerase